MRAIRAFLVVALALTSAPCLYAADKTPKDLKERLEARYKHKKVRVLPEGVAVGLVPAPIPVFYVDYDHFHPPLEMPAKWKKRANFDDQTSEYVSGPDVQIDKMQSGEALQVYDCLFRQHSGEFYTLDLYLIALSLSTRRVTTQGGERYGVHFRFAFAPSIVEAGNYDTIVGAVNQYFLPEDEYREKQATGKQAATEVHEAAKRVEIQPGMTKEEVLKALGEPLKTIVFGKKTILKYADITVELEDDKVVEVKAN